MPFDHCNAFGFQLMLHYFTLKTIQERKCKTIRFTNFTSLGHKPTIGDESENRSTPVQNFSLIDSFTIRILNYVLFRSGMSFFFYFLLIIHELIHLEKKLIINNLIPQFYFAAFYLHFHKPCSKVSIIFQDACF